MVKRAVEEMTEKAMRRDAGAAGGGGGGGGRYSVM